MKTDKLPLTIILIAAISLLSGCSGIQEKEEETEASSDHLLQISNKQFETEGMQLGNTVTHLFTQGFKTNGIVSASPQSKADLYSYIPGIIKSISVNLGSFVRKGQELCTIESKEFINLQQQYLESLAKLKATELNYQRVGQLYNEKIASQKDFLAIESEYKILNARIEARKAELKILNVNLQKLEEGNLSAYLPILSPIEGSITLQAGNIGQFVDPHKLLMKIVNNKDLQLYFFVYQEYINQLQLGQMLNVYNPDNSEMTCSARIISIGKSIDTDSKSIQCIAEFVGQQSDVLIDGMYFQVEVIVKTFSAKALPSEAIIKTGNKNHILIKEKQDDNGLFFMKEEVKIGIVSNGFTQIMGDEDLNEVLIKGTYYYQTE